jgi:hypothetical protein
MGRSPNSLGINLVIIAIDPPTRLNGQLRIVVHFSSSDAAWDSAEIQLVCVDSFYFLRIHLLSLACLCSHS